MKFLIKIITIVAVMGYVGGAAADWAVTATLKERLRDKELALTSVKREITALVEKIKKSPRAQNLKSDVTELKKRSDELLSDIEQLKKNNTRTNM